MNIDTQFIVEETKSINYSEIANVANASFGRKKSKFEKQQVQHLYHDAFGGDSAVVSVIVDGEKVGHAAILWHIARLNGQQIRVAQLVDLFVLPGYRSFKIVRGIYAKLNCLLDEFPDCLVITVPNPRSTVFNKRFLKLELREKFDVRFGMCIPQFGRTDVSSFGVEDRTSDQVLESLKKYLLRRNTVEVLWTPVGLYKRISGGVYKFALHESDGILMLTSARSYKGIPIFLVCAIFCLYDQSNENYSLRRLLKSAAHYYQRPCFLYVGVNRSLFKLPGISLPDRFRSSPMQLQLREPKKFGSQICFDRFEAIDFDFA